MTHSSVLFVARANFAGLFFIVFAVEINRSMESAFVCVCHCGHQFFELGFHFKIFRSQVATKKKKLILRPELEILLLLYIRRTES